MSAKMLRWGITIHFEPEREWTGEILAHTVEAALILALSEAERHDGELVHVVHIGPPKETH